MTTEQARDILNRVRLGDKSPTRLEIIMALLRTGDLA